MIPCFFLRFFFGAGTAFFSSVSVFRFSSGAGCRALCNREDCVAPGRRAYCVKDVKVTSERWRSVRLFYNQRFSIIPTWNAHLCIQHYAFFGIKYSKYCRINYILTLIRLQIYYRQPGRYIYSLYCTSLFESLLSWSCSVSLNILCSVFIITKVTTGNSLTKIQVCKSSFSDKDVLKFDVYILLHTCINIKSFIFIATVYVTMKMLF